MKHHRGWLLFILSFLAGCLPIPDVRLGLDLPPPEFRFAPEWVRSEYVTLPSVAAPQTPEELNRTAYLRYFDATDEAHTIIVLVPGLFGGPASFDILARQLVASTPGVEVWAVERRSHMLADRSAILESMRRRDPSIAYAYYVENLGTPEGFNPLEPDEVRFMAFWGLEVHLQDLHRIVVRAYHAGQKVVLGGHSLGASIVSYYAAKQFEDGVGHERLSGLVLIDGGLGRTGGFERDAALFSIGPWRLLPSVEELELGAGNPYLVFLRGPVFFSQAETAVLLARYQPDELSPGGYTDYPATNRAVVGLMADDHYALSTAFGVSLGEAVGARYAGNLLAFVLGGLMSVSSRSVAGVAEGHEYITWGPGDPERERTDIDSFVRAWLSPYTSFGEWYFPARLLLDVTALGLRLDEVQGFVPNREVLLPTLAVGTERGLVTSLDSFSGYMNARPGSPFSAYIMPGMTHLDIVTARENPLVTLMQTWLRTLP
jgi:pimeloyl-ACP methyl ester carboxylesterase